MSDVRLTATNPEDGSVVPVACNAKGEFLLEEPIAPPEFDGNLDGDLVVTGNGRFGGASVNFAGHINLDSDGNFADPNIWLNSIDGSAKFSGDVQIGGDAGNNPREAGIYLFQAGGVAVAGPSNQYLWNGYTSGESTTSSSIQANGVAVFSGDVTVGSRNKQWMLVEQGGLCHMVEQISASTAEIDPSFAVDPALSAPVSVYPKLRDVFAELDVVEKALEQVMEKLRMVEPDGWPVWDGSSNS